MKVEHKQASREGYNLSVVIQGKYTTLLGLYTQRKGNNQNLLNCIAMIPHSKMLLEKIICIFPAVQVLKKKTAEGILIELQQELKDCNPYIRNFIQICEIPNEELSNATFLISENERPGDAHSKTYTSHNLTEVSTCMPEDYAERGVIVRKRGGGIKEFNDRRRSSNPLHFVLFHRGDMTAGQLTYAKLQTMIERSTSA